MIDWINNAPVADLAVELFTAFGPDGVRGGEAVNSDDLSNWMLRAYPKQAGLIVQARPVGGPIMEAVQLLKHSELIYLRWIANDYPVWSVTRLGTSTLTAGKDAVRQRLKARTGL
jgi:hypothetical protein